MSDNPGKDRSKFLLALDTEKLKRLDAWCEEQKMTRTEAVRKAIDLLLQGGVVRREPQELEEPERAKSIEEFAEFWEELKEIQKKWDESEKL